MAGNKFPTNYTDKGSADATDKIWSSDTVANFNITVSEVWDRNFADKSTSNLSEWTNKYYTDTLADANPTLIWKADKTNVIEKDSVIPFIPTLWTHPANKDYVDNFIVPSATETVEGISELSDASQATAWTDDTTIMTPKKVKDNYTLVWTTKVWTIDLINWAQANITIAHWLWKVPRQLTTEILDVNIDTGSASYDGTTIVQKTFTDIEGIEAYQDLLFQTWASFDRWAWAIISIDSTNITLAYTHVWNPTWVGTFDYKIDFIW